MTRNTRHGLAYVIAFVVAPFAVCTLVWLADGAQRSFRPARVAVPAVLPLARLGLRGYRLGEERS